MIQSIQSETKYSIHRADSQSCPVEPDKATGELIQKSAPFFAYNKVNYKNKVLLARKNPIANSIFEFFVSEMDNTNAICVSMATLEVLFELKRNAISKHIKYLQDHDFITIFKNGNMNVYAVNAFVVWTQGDAKIWKAKFTATMYMNYDEQSAKVQREHPKVIKTK